jgi:hypothetical protein
MGFVQSYLSPYIEILSGQTLVPDRFPWKKFSAAVQNKRMHRALINKLGNDNKHETGITYHSTQLGFLIYSNIIAQFLFALLHDSIKSNSMKI